MLFAGVRGLKKRAMAEPDLTSHFISGVGERERERERERDSASNLALATEGCFTYEERALHWNGTDRTETADDVFFFKQL